MSDKIVNFPNNNDREFEHICDTCTSMKIHELTHQYTDVDHYEIIEAAFYKAMEAFDVSQDAMLGVLSQLYYDGYFQGAKDAKVEMLHSVSKSLASILSISDRDEEQ